MRALRSRETFRQAIVVVIPENNNDNVATGDWARSAAAFPPVIVYQQRVKEPASWGVRTTDYLKERMVRHMRMLLTTDGIVLYKHPVAIQTDAEHPTDYYKTLHDELIWFAEHRVAPSLSNTFGEYKTKYSGKGHGQKDDAVMSLLIGAYFATDYLQDEQLAAMERNTDVEITSDLVDPRRGIVDAYNFVR